MAEELTQEQLLLLNNLMYVKDITYSDKYPNMQEFIRAYEDGEIVLSKANLSGGFENNIGQFETILEEIKNDPEIMALSLDKSTEGVVRATCFVQHDESGAVVDHIVAFRGTGGVYEAWKDNFEGAYETDTEAQLLAAEYIKNQGYTDLTLTGHSKGGNLAMYCTVVQGDLVKKCVSYDGQGFGEGFQEKYHYPITLATDKITSISAENDFVNILLEPIAGTNVYVANDGTGADGHSPYALWNTNKAALTENGGSFLGLEVEQNGLMKWAHEKQAEIIAALPPDEKELAMDLVGALAATGLSKDADWAKTWDDIKGNIKEYVVDQKLGALIDTKNKVKGYLKEDFGRLFESAEEKAAREAEVAALKAAAEAEQKALEEAMEAYRKELDKSYILHTAMVVCDKAYTNEAINPSYIVLPQSHGETIHGLPMLTVEDSIADVNVLNFGICRSPKNPSVQAAARRIIEEVQEETDSWLDKVLGIFVDKSKKTVSTSETESLAAYCAGVCTPKFYTKWIDGKEDVLIDGTPALIGSCTLGCVYGGTITIQSSGQMEE